MNSDPGVNIGAINTARRTHVRHNAQEFAGFELTQAFRSRFAADNLVSAAFQHSAHITHYRGLILDEHGTVVDLSWACDSSVNQIRDDPEDNSRLEVWFWAFSPVCYLTRDHPEFERIRSTLTEAATAGSRVWLANRFHMIEGTTETWHKLMDVRPSSEVVFAPTSQKGNDGKVLTQSPGGGKNAAKGSSVTIVVGHFTPPPPPTTSSTTLPPPTTT